MTSEPDAKRRILFVDDEASVLDGLRNVLRKQRGKWDMVFALGGAAALAELDQGRFDVVVSDMRMPGLDGAALLAEVRARDPGVTRLILSGHADRDLIAKALPVAHQFLSKPCDVQVLRAVIERACGLHALLADDALRGVVGRMEHLPSPPATYMRLLALLTSPTASLATVAAVIEEDMALTAKLLQLVNSAYFGLPRQVSSIRDAIGYLGLDLVSNLTLSAHVFAQASPGLAALDRLHDESLIAARLAARFAGGRPACDDAFTAGLVHDIGRVVLWTGLPAVYRDITDRAAARGEPVIAIEREVLRVTHAEIGAYLLGVWGVPMAIVEAVAYHHDPSGVQDPSVGVVPHVHVAAALVDRVAPDAAFLERAGLAGAAAAWSAIALRELSAA